MKFQNLWSYALITAIIFAILLYYYDNTHGNKTHAQDRKFQLETRDVLLTIARPLSEDGDGFYLPNVDLRNVNLVGVDFSHAILSYSDLSGSLFENANLSYVGLQESNLMGAEFINADLTYGWFLYSNLENVVITYSTADYANFEDSNLTNADLTGSSLVNVNLRGADLTNARFQGAIMEGVTLPNGKIYEEGDDLVALFGAYDNP